jgi:hypothetical protein
MLSRRQAHPGRPPRPPSAAAAFGYILTLAYAILPLAGLPFTAWLGFLAAPHAIAATYRRRRYYHVPPELIPVQAWTLLSFVLMSLGIGAGFILAAVR